MKETLLSTERIVFAGNGVIGEVCLKALQKKFTQIDIVKADNENVQTHRRTKDRLVNNINESVAHWVFLAGWHPIISKTDLQKKCYLNIHGSLLPKYRGIHSIFWAIMNGETELGYTIHEVNEFVDDGDILYQYRFPYKNYTSGEVQKLFYEDLDKNLGKVISDYIEGLLSPLKQNREMATWVPKRNLDDCLVDFSMPNQLLRRFFLALTEPYPLPRLIHKGICYEIIQSEIVDIDYYCELGRAVNSDSTGVYIKVKDGLLIIKKIRSTVSGEIIEANRVIRSGYRFKLAGVCNMMHESSHFHGYVNPQIDFEGGGKKIDIEG